MSERACAPASLSPRVSEYASRQLCDREQRVWTECDCVYRGMRINFCACFRLHSMMELRATGSLEATRSHRHTGV